MEVPGNDIAETVLKNFDKLPAKRKPQARGGGVREWVPLSGIVAQGRDGLRCLAIATGMKCLPESKIPRAQGHVLHDWHAEILAIRSFNRFLLEECHALAVSKKQTSEYIRLRSASERTEIHFQPFALKDGINLHMYCSEAPCGDASMELTIAAQDDDTPWTLPPSYALSPASASILESSFARTIPVQDTTLHGRSYFSALGIIRRKPSRPDAPPTLSKSCSDKLALKQSTSLLSSLTSLLISPTNCYLDTLVLPQSQYSAIACNRSFGVEARQNGRLNALIENGSCKDWGNGYLFKPFKVITTGKEFRYSRRAKVEMCEKLVPSNISASWTANGTEESLIGGVLQGRQQFSVNGESRFCKTRMWLLAIDVASLAGVEAAERLLTVRTYKEVKDGGLLEGRRSVKQHVITTSLKGWLKNDGGDGFESRGVNLRK